jgi:hypothetical protein
VAAGKKLDRVREQLLRAGKSGGLVPGAKVREWKEPRSKAADREAAFADESVPTKKRTVPFVEEREMSGYVSWSFDSAKRADEIALGDQPRGPGVDSRDASLDFALTFVGLEGSIRRLS